MKQAYYRAEFKPETKDVGEGTTIEVSEPDIKNRPSNFRRISIGQSKDVIHAVGDDIDTEDAAYLGATLREVVNRAIAGSAECAAAALDLFHSVVEVAEEPESEDPPARRPVTLREWLAAGRPPVLMKWAPVHVYYGVSVETPTDAEMELFIKGLE